MLSSATELQELLQLAPDWSAVYESVRQSTPAAGVTELLQRLGALAIYKKLAGAGDTRAKLGLIVRDHYFQALVTRMATVNPNLRRFWSQRRVDVQTQQAQARSFGMEVAQKLDGVLSRHLSQNAEDGHKVLLPAYMQRSVQNAVVDYIRQECDWERATLQDLNLDPEQEDPRQSTADDPRYMPENKAISAEQVQYLNQLREQISKLLKDDRAPQDALAVVDCIFGLGLTKHSQSGVEMTMREVCEKLSLAGDTQARKIARCQVLLDKGLDTVRTMVRQKMPGVAEFFQQEININTASRRELGHMLGLTEGEVDRLIVARQFYSLGDLVERNVLKSARVPEIRDRGAVAAFVPVDLNSATTRDLIDILQIPKDIAQKVASQRPFSKLADLTDKRVMDATLLQAIIERGCVLKVATAQRIDLNRAAEDDVARMGLSTELVRRLMRGRPFTTWAELEEYLSCDASAWALLRQKCCLGLGSG